MRKFLLTLLFFVIASTAHATVYYACTSGGTWSGSIWVTSTGAQAACTGATTITTGDTATLNASSGNITATATSIATLNETGYTGTLSGAVTLTVTAGATLQGTNTLTGITVSGGGVTLAGSTSGSTALITFTTIGQTLTSNSNTWAGAVTFDFAGTFTLSGNWVTSGTTTTTLALTLNFTTNETYTVNGGMVLTAAWGGTATILYNGGSWTGLGTITANMTIGGNVTMTSASMSYSTGTLTYSSGTITQTSGVLLVGANSTLNLSGWTFNTISFAVNATYTVTLTSNLYATTIQSNGLAPNTTLTLSGAYSIFCTNFYWSDTSSGTVIINLPAGQSLNVSGKINITPCQIGTPSSFTLKSATAGSPIYLNYTGALSNESVTGASFTDVVASGNRIYDSTAGFVTPTLTRTANIFTFTPANVYLQKPVIYNNGI